MLCNDDHTFVLASRIMVNSEFCRFGGCKYYEAGAKENDIKCKKDEV